MTPEVAQLYERARALDPEARSVFVDEACRRDPRLRKELVSLLEEAEAAESFFDLLSDAVFRTPFSLDEGRGEPAIGATVGHYRILSLIGSGGMGTVYRAHDTRLDRDVALKFLPPLSTWLDAEERLLTEARAAAALEHPNVCSIYEIGQTDDGQSFIAMALYEGETLKERLRGGPLPLEESVAISVQIARGLGAAHARGIVHRDVKPGNVILGADGTVRLLDFGLAQMANANLSGSWMTPGTAAYMSPEQARRERLDSRTDLWSLGIVLYELLTGVRPFQGESDRELLQAIVETDPDPVSSLRPDIPRPLELVVERMLRKDPGDRYQSAAELLADLERVLPSIAAPISPWKRARTLAAVGTSALLSLVGFAFWLRGVEPLETAADRSETSRYRSGNLAAYELLLRAGDPSLTRTDSGFRQKVEYLRQAIAVDSTYAAAYAELAAAYALMGDPFSVGKSDLLEAAEETARKALGLDDSLATAYWVLSLVRLSENDYASAEAEIRRAIALGPADSRFHAELSRVLIASGRPSEALVEAQRALEISPSSATIRVEFAEALFANGRYDEALARLEPVLSIQPSVRRAVLLAGKCFIMKEMWTEAISALRPQAGEEGPRARYLLGYALARAGQREEAQRILTELLEGRERGQISAFDVAVVYAGFGDSDRAFAWLDEAADESAVDWETIKEPLFADLQRDPRFERLRQRLEP